MSSHLLVTGGCGFVGSNFVRFVLGHRPECLVTNLDCLSYSANSENLAEFDTGGPSGARYRFVQGDIRDRAVVEPLIDECDAIVHFAAESHVDRSIMDARPFIEANVMGVQTLLDVMRRVEHGPKANGRRFVQIGTDEVYGSLPLERRDLKFTEESPIDPHSPYSASKAAADMLVTAYHHTYGLDVVVTRCSNNFGPYQFPEKVIPLFVTNLLEGKKVPLYGDGQNVRDWLHVDDHCEAILSVLERGGAGQVYNIGGNNERSNLELTLAVLRIMDQDEKAIQRVKDRPGHDRRYAIDATKIKQQLGWGPTRSTWPEALRSTVQWYIEHEDWWKRIKSVEYWDYYRRQYEGDY